MSKKADSHALTARFRVEGLKRIEGQRPYLMIDLVKEEDYPGTAPEVVIPLDGIFRDVLDGSVLTITVENLPIGPEATP